MKYFKPVWAGMSPGQKRDLAERMDSDYTYLSQIANGHRNPGKHFKKNLDRELERITHNESQTVSPEI